MRARSALDVMFVQGGFELLRTSKHHIWGCPCGHAKITAPATPGKGRSVNNTRAIFTRTLRVCHQNLKEKS